MQGASESVGHSWHATQPPRARTDSITALSSSTSRARGRRGSKDRGAGVKRVSRSGLYSYLPFPMKRLFRRPPTGKSSPAQPPAELRSEADLNFLTYDAESESCASNTLRRLHTRAWSLESDLRISRGE